MTSHISATLCEALVDLEAAPRKVAAAILPGVRTSLVDSETPAVSDMSSSRARIGATLAAARTARSLDLADVARDTRVPLRHLRAIEADAHDSLPALPYSIGFVKSLARAVGIDPDAAAAQFRAETSKTAHVPAAVALEPLDERRLPSREVVVLSGLALLLLLGGLIAYGSGLFDRAPPPPPVVITATPAASAPATTPADTSIAVPLAVAPGTAAPTVAVPVVGGAVVITPSEDVWVKIYDHSRTTVKTGIIKGGEAYTVPTDPPGLLLWTGKAGVLAITVGGRAIPVLGGPAQTVKDVSLTPGDLLARAVPPAAATVSAAAPQAR